MSLKLDRVTEIFIKDREKLIHFIRKKINGISDMDAEDIMSEVFVNIFDKADIENQIGNLTAYIYTSLKNRIVDFVRNSKKRQYTENALGDNPHHLIDNIPDQESDLESVFQKKENERLLQSFLMSLDKDQRDVIIATELEGKSFKELSEEWKIPMGTLLSRKNRALNKLKKISKKESDDSE